MGTTRQTLAQEADLRTDQSLVLFDGECAVCDASVMFIIDHDPDGRFVFAPLQSALGRRVVEEQLPQLKAGAGRIPETLVVFDRRSALTDSPALLHIGRRLRGPVRLLSWLLWLVPRPLRDAAYRAFVARRLRWFGTLEQCRVPTPELRERFRG